MKFGIHNPSWLFGTEPAGIFDAVKAKAQWAETHGFTWFSVMDHLIQIGNVGAPDRLSPESRYRCFAITLSACDHAGMPSRPGRFRCSRRHG